MKPWLMRTTIDINNRLPRLSGVDLAIEAVFDVSDKQQVLVVP